MADFFGGGEVQDVIIVGGGPTGFINALGLARAGIRLTVLESESRIRDAPRAAVYHWSIIDGLEKLGIREEIERAGFAGRTTPIWCSSPGNASNSAWKR